MGYYHALFQIDFSVGTWTSISQCVSFTNDLSGYPGSTPATVENILNGSAIPDMPVSFLHTTQTTYTLISGQNYKIEHKIIPTNPAYNPYNADPAYLKPLYLQITDDELGFYTASYGWQDVQLPPSPPTPPPVPDGVLGALDFTQFLNDAYCCLGAMGQTIAYKKSIGSNTSDLEQQALKTLFLVKSIEKYLPPNVLPQGQTNCLSDSQAMQIIDMIKENCSDRKSVV